MTLKDKAKTYNFWISLVSAVILIIRIIGDKFNIFIDTTLMLDITTGLCSIFVVLGILSAPKASQITKITEQILLNMQDQKTQNNEAKSKSETDNSFETNGSDKTTAEQHIDPVEENKSFDLENNKQISIEDLDHQTKCTTETVFTSQPTNHILFETIEQLKAEVNKANKIIEEISNNE